MPGKQKIQLPIDRPLSRAYLREFGGWSTEYPPGLSDPTSLRVMENILIGRDGSAKIRPGLRYLSYSELPGESTYGVGLEEEAVGSHETFFLNDGTLAYLFAVRETDGTVGFRVLVRGDAGSVVLHLTDPGVDFLVPQGEAVLNFTEATTYVKYLQIDNKIFALSNAGERMRLFDVGTSKLAKKMTAIERPDWTVSDKLTVVHPDAPWIDDALPNTVRTNYLVSPSFETAGWWYPLDYTNIERVTSPTPHTGSYCLAVSSLPQRTNLVGNPLSDVATYGISRWSEGTGSPTLSISGTYLRADFPAGTNPRAGRVQSSTCDVVARHYYRAAFTLGGIGTNTDLQVRFRWLDASSVQVGSDDVMNLVGIGSGDRAETPAIECPVGAVMLRVLICGVINKTGASYLSFKNVVVCEDGESTAAMSGDDGADYFWTGTAGLSPAVYHPTTDLIVRSTTTEAEVGADHTMSAYVRAATTARACSIGFRWYNNAGSTVVDEAYDTVTDNDASGSWTRTAFTDAAPTGAPKVQALIKIAAVPRGEVHYIDSCLLERTSSLEDYFDGDTADTSTEINEWVEPTIELGNTAQWSQQTVYATAGSHPLGETATAATLVGDSSVENDYNFGFFYTFANEVGETAPSQVTVITTQRGWSAWKWETPSATGEPSGTRTSDPTACADQLVASLPESVFDEALSQGAIAWNLYMTTWSSQDTVPSTAIRIATRELHDDSLYDSDGWLRVTPQQVGANELSVSLPSMENRVNYSEPSRGGQGLVAADRMVLVLDPTQAARIKWSSNQQGSYTDFTANRGGGYKTLTTGNLYVPACVKLWQNPQSVDTLTILCLGTDGRSTGYYMAPSSITQQSESVTVMGFEETTATPGTTSPYGCEVFNNALYHPLDDQLMKSTANNYNISHKSVTDQIRTDWSRLQNKQRIVSSQLDNRLYYIVHNPRGETLEPGCRGNEVWVFDAQAEAGTWSRWLVQGQSLRAIERGGRVYMSIVRPDGLFYFDPDYSYDDFVHTNGNVLNRPIPWQLETNLQGANRAHDAWAHLQQLKITLGNFSGRMEYGIRFQDVHGKSRTLTKQVWDNPIDYPQYPLTEISDHLRIARDAMEWYFFARSVTNDFGDVEHSAGQISLVQYRYTPSTVNTGYEWGSVETFEYTRSLVSSSRSTESGVPRPMAYRGEQEPNIVAP